MMRTSLLSCAVVVGALLGPCALQPLGADVVTLESTVTMDNIGWSLSSGTLNWLSNWELEASVGAFNSTHGFAHDYQFTRWSPGTPATAVGQASTVYTITSARIEADAAGALRSLAFSTRSVFPPPVDSIHSSGWATGYREFRITGGIGPVNVTFSFDYAVRLYGTVQPGQYHSVLDYGAVLRVTDGTTTWDVSDIGSRRAPVDFSFSKTGTATLVLQYDTPYAMSFSAFDATSPEPWASMLISSLALGGYAVWRKLHRRERPRQHAQRIPPCG